VSITSPQSSRNSVSGRTTRSKNFSNVSPCFIPFKNIDILKFVNGINADQLEKKITIECIKKIIKISYMNKTVFKMVTVFVIFYNKYIFYY